MGELVDRGRECRPNAVTEVKIDLGQALDRGYDSPTQTD